MLRILLNTLGACRSGDPAACGPPRNYLAFIDILTQILQLLKKSKFYASGTAHPTHAKIVMFLEFVTHFQGNFNSHNANLCDIRKNPLPVTHETASIVGDKTWIFLYVA